MLIMHIIQFINEYHHLYHIYISITETRTMEATHRGDYDHAPRTHNDGDRNDDIGTSSTRTHGGDFLVIVLLCFVIYLWPCMSFLLSFVFIPSLLIHMEYSLCTTLRCNLLSNHLHHHHQSPVVVVLV